MSGGILFLWRIVWVRRMVQTKSECMEILSLYNFSLKRTVWGQQDGSVGKVACCQALVIQHSPNTHGELGWIPRAPNQSGRHLQSQHLECGSWRIRSSSSSSVISQVQDQARLHETLLYAHTHICTYMHTHIWMNGTGRITWRGGGNISKHFTCPQVSWSRQSQLINRCDSRCLRCGR